MTLTLGMTAPNFDAMTTEGPIRFHDWMDGHWCMLFSHPKDFTPVCTTELGTMAKMMPAFEARGIKVIGLGIDPVEAHHDWKKDIHEVTGAEVTYPLIGDSDLKVAKILGMLPEDAGTTAEGRTAADNQTVRSVFVFAPDKTIKLMIAYPMTTGRDFNEILRAIDSLMLTVNHKVATPANWQQGEDVFIVPSVNNVEARVMFPDGWTAPKPYMRMVKQPA